MTTIGAVRLRWFYPFVMLLCSLLSYLDRNCLAVLSPVILTDLHLSAKQYGFVISAFSVAYTMGNPAWGAAIDRFGVRFGMLAAVLIWTFASAAHAWAYNLVALMLVRLLLGFAEGATFPGALATIVMAMRPAERSRSTAIAFSGGSLGAVLAPLILVPAGVAFGWRAVFLLTGLTGLLWCGIWLIASRPLTARDHLSSQAKRDYRNQPANWREPRLWGGVILYAVGAFPVAAGTYLAPLLMNRVYGITQRDLGGILWIPPAGWELGYLACGWLLDRLTTRRRLNSGSFALFFLAAAVCSAPLVFVASVNSPGVALAILFFAMFGSAGFIIGSVTYVSLVLGPSRSGLTAGLTSGAWSALVALGMPLLGYLFDDRRYLMAFILVSAMPPFSVLLWLLMTRIWSRPLEPHGVAS